MRGERGERERGRERERERAGETERDREREREELYCKHTFGFSFEGVHVLFCELRVFVKQL